MKAHSFHLPALVLAALLCAAITPKAPAAPVQTPWPVAGSDDTAAVAAAPMSGWYVTADTFKDTIEIRTIDQSLFRTISRARIAALVPWMTLDGGPDGPGGLACSSSGRLVFILVHDDAPGGGPPSDAVLRYDLSSDTLSLSTRLELFDRGDVPARTAAIHHRGVLYVASPLGTLSAIPATAGLTSASVAGTFTLPGGGPVRGLAVERDTGLLFSSNGSAIFRAPFPVSAASAPVWTQVATVAAGSEIRSLTWGDHYGGAGQRGLYILAAPAGGGSRIDFLSSTLVLGGTGLTPSTYLTTAADWSGLVFTADGRLLVGADEDAVLIADDTDTRFGYSNFIIDEFNQHVAFARGLISPDGQPPGWVIDADVDPSINRFHPATPDAACWAILMLLASDRVNGDTLAQSQVRLLLQRYAGFAPDNIRPTRSVDGIYKHWLSPTTGNTQSGWADEYATLSTMKMVVAASRALDYYPDDPVIARAASRIIFGVSNWHLYFQSGTDALAFKGLSGSGADTSSFARPYHEGILFAEEAGAYGNAAAAGVANRWFTRSLWPTATFVSGRPITTGQAGAFQPAFLTHYPMILSTRFRNDTSPAGWPTQVANLRWSSAAWTDDNGPRYYTVFSAGTSPAGGGYNADSLGGHPGDITTFTSLGAFASSGETPESVGAYAAYRKGARQTFKSGASILYRRPVYASNTFVPNSAGLPDVSIGGLGLAELIDPSVTASVLARPYTPVEMCPLDLNADGLINEEDLYVQSATPADLNGDGTIAPRDTTCLRNWIRRAERATTATR